MSDTISLHGAAHEYALIVDYDFDDDGELPISIERPAGDEGVTAFLTLAQVVRLHAHLEELLR